jgi:hypothetical protein
MKQAAGNPDALILIDQEGGRVARLRPPHWREYPSGATYGALWPIDPDLAGEAAFLGARLIADDLFQLGINVDCLPVLDVPVPGADNIIGDRAYGTSPSIVMALGRAAADGLLAGGVLEAGVRLHPVLGGVTLAAVLFLSPMRDYLYEITHHYHGPIDGIVEYLSKHGKPDDIVAITYGDLPVKFYTGMRVVGGLTGEDLSPASKAKWVVIRRHAISQRDASVAQYFFANLRREDYQAIELDCVDLMWNNRECPDLHVFRTVRNGPSVVIFERVVP